MNHKPTIVSARPAVTLPAAGPYRPQAGAKLYFLMTEAHFNLPAALHGGARPNTNHWSPDGKPDALPTAPARQKVAHITFMKPLAQ